MVRITLFLLLLILRNNAYAWSCSFSTTAEGWYLDGSMSCQGIPTEVALQNHYCDWYRPSDPYCSIYQVPVCQDQVEYRSLSCLVHYSGAINQSRSFSCSTNAWSDWYTTSDNCVQDPPTCIESTETRQLACSSGLEGLLQEQRTSICSDPYGTPTWTTWLELLNTCKMTATNVNNVASPVSPISPLNPNSVINQVTTAPIIQPEPVIVQDMTALTTTETPTTSVATVQSTSQTASTTTSNSTGSSVSKSTTTTSGTDKKEDIKAVVVPKGKDLVPGFGIVLSMQLLNSGYNMQQQQIEESIKLIQEQDYERQQNIFIDFIVSNDSRDYLIRASANRWRSILRDNPIQRLDLDD